MRLTEFSVKILDNTFNSTPFQIWKKSRDFLIKDSSPLTFEIGGEIVDKKEYKDSIDKMNLQYNDFYYMVVEMEGPMILRDFFYTINEFHKWATSTRLLYSCHEKFDENNYPVDEKIADLSIFQDWMKKVKTGVGVDSHRDLMPMAASSTFWVGGSFRLFCDALTYMKMKLPELYKLYGDEIVKKLNLRTYDYLPDSIAKYEYTYRDNDIESEMNMVFYSQWIRHTPLVAKGYFEFIRDTDLSKLTGGSLFKVSSDIPPNRLKRIISQRSCWFSMSDERGTWGDLISSSIKNKEELKEIIPCHCDPDKCTYQEDLRFRNSGLEKQIPCPFLMKDKVFADQRHSDHPTKLNKFYKELMN